MKEGMTRKQWIRIENRLKPCPFCGQRVRLIRSDGGDCRMSRECRHGFYIQCLACDLLFGYEPNRGGIYRIEDLDKLVRDWCEGKARARRVLAVPYKMTWAAARVNAGLSQIEVGERLGFSAQHICNMEKGRYTVTPRSREALAKLYKVEPEWIEEVGE